MPSTIPYTSIPVRRSQRAQGTFDSTFPARLAELDLEPLGLPMPLRTQRPAGSLGAPPPAGPILQLVPPAAEVIRPDFGRTRARDTAALRALAARVLPALERRRGFAPSEGLRPANDIGASLRPDLVSAAPPSAWSLVVSRAVEPLSEPPATLPPGCA